uniref:Protein FAR1-RELATED SEQUENCE 5 n=1 Tax=Cajanus cajan TaxID=3821 RepID=A0A151S1Z4_CAJCA|nr:Protein FAR1-RELATED SEQUENCE 5 [Cajanus cajan]
MTFDPTYLKNKYKMSFVPFTIINHHQQSILLGCGLLCHEIKESFVWLLCAWLEEMSKICPKTITINKDVIGNAIARVFVEVSHHYCMWHIEKKKFIFRLNYILVILFSSICNFGLFILK